MAKQNKGGALNKLNPQLGVVPTAEIEQPIAEPQAVPTAELRPKKEKPKKQPRAKKEKPSLLGKLNPSENVVRDTTATMPADAVSPAPVTYTPPAEPRHEVVAETSVPPIAKPGSSTDVRVPPTPEEMPAQFDYQSFEEEVAANEELTVERERRSEHQHAVWQKVATILLIVGCVYLIFLSYGALNTRYVYEDGVVVPQQMTVSQIRDLKEFNVIATEYRQARNLYEKALRLDYRVAEGLEDPLLIAPEYESLLEQIESLLIQCQATSVSPKYNQVHLMLQSWIGTDIAVYCQSMSKAISQNDSKEAAKALEFRSRMYNDFSMITANITTVGETVDGADIADIKKWSPEGFINENIGDPGGALDG